MESHFVCYRSLWFGKLLSNGFFVSCPFWTMNIKFVGTGSAFALSNGVCHLPTRWTMEISLHYYLIICFKIQSQSGVGGYNFSMWWELFNELIRSKRNPLPLWIPFQKFWKPHKEGNFLPTPLDILRFSKGTVWPQNKTDYTNSTVVSLRQCLWVGAVREQGQTGLWGTK